jgi:signal peptidase I
MNRDARPRGRALAAAALGLAAAGLAVHALRRLVLVTVAGSSMEPTYRSGDRVVVVRRPGSLVRRGQVVVVAAPTAGLGWHPGMPPVRSAIGNWLIKRAVAVAGDPVPASVAAALAPGTTTVPAGSLVVLGDGKRSGDSRMWGLVPVDQVLGVVMYERRHRPNAGGSSGSPAT